MVRSLRVSILHRNLDIAGGGERIVLELANRLCDRGYDIRLFTFSYDRNNIVTRLSPKVSIELIPRRYVSPWPLYNEAASILFFPKAFKWGDVVFCSDFHTGHITATLISKLLRKPIVYYCHWPLLYSIDRGLGLLQDLRRLPLLLFDRFLSSRTDIFMTNSQHTAQFVRRIYGVTPRVVYPGVDVEKFRDEPIEKSSPIVLSVCRVDPIKRIELLIKSMKLVLKDLQDVKLYVVGSTDNSPDYICHLVSLIKKLGMEETVFFTGKIFGEPLLKFYQICDIFCLFSREETFGISVIEAMSCGKPVIVSDAGALPELVEDGKTGFVIHGDREEPYAEKIKFLLAHPEIRARMGKEGRRMVEKRFTWDIFIDLVEDAITNLVKQSYNSTVNDNKC